MGVEVKVDVAIAVAAYSGSGVRDGYIVGISLCALQAVRIMQTSIENRNSFFGMVQIRLT